MRRDVTFKSEGEQCAGWLFLPDGLAEGARVPAVVMANAITAVKEMYLANYGVRLAAAGFAAHRHVERRLPKSTPPDGIFAGEQKRLPSQRKGSRP